MNTNAVLQIGIAPDEPKPIFLRVIESPDAPASTAIHVDLDGVDQVVNELLHAKAAMIALIEAGLWKAPGV